MLCIHSVCASILYVNFYDVIRSVLRMHVTCVMIVSLFLLLSPSLRARKGGATRVARPISIHSNVAMYDANWNPGQRSNDV